MILVHFSFKHDYFLYLLLVLYCIIYIKFNITVSILHTFWEYYSYYQIMCVNDANLQVKFHEVATLSLQKLPYIRRRKKINES